MNKKLIKTKPFLRWPGGKYDELDEFSNYFPKNINNYYEPFVGGGSVFFNIKSKSNYINDKSQDLINLYNSVKNQDEDFLTELEKINYYWENIVSLFNFEKIHSSFEKVKENKISEIKLINFLTTQLKHIEPAAQNFFISIFSYYIYKAIKKNYDFNLEYFETIIKTGYYNYIRHLYNLKTNNINKHSAYYYFVLNYCYGGLSRFNASGEFNVPYSGSYNNKKFNFEYLSNNDILKQLNQTKISNLDYIQFLDQNLHRMKENDFIFLDPPYDCMFNNYDNNPFIKKQQIILAGYLFNKVKCKWMMVISETELINTLYKNNANIYIKSFSKTYRVNIQKRNNQKATHLIISNYPLEE